MTNRMNPDYARSSEPQPNRSTFNVSESHKHTWSVSNIMPVYWDYLYPGEVRRGKTRLFVRLTNPLDQPLMDNAYITIHVFSVALRNLWDNFRKFWGERENPNDSIDYTIPTMSGNFDMTAQSPATWGGNARLWDALGVPQSDAVRGADVSALPARAYYKIWNHWYRDPSLQTSRDVGTDDGPDNWDDYFLQQRGKRWDYFTNVLPAPQRGESITIGGEIQADVGSGVEVHVKNFNNVPRALAADNPTVEMDGATVGDPDYLYPNTTINELRNAVAIQQFLERDNRAGQQFGDLIKAHYGANFTDAKYMPVFIGGGRAPFVFSSIPNTAADSGQAGDVKPLGELASIGTSVFEGASFTYRAEEPEILMICAMVDADLTYHQGLNRKFSYRTRYDFVYPEFEGIGDQALYNQELYYQGGADTDDPLVFGYSPRYEEARTGINQLHGLFRPDFVQPLDTWHLAQDFTTRPLLNSSYIISAPPFNRVMVNTETDQILADFHFSMKSTKPLSVRGIPGLARL